MCRQDVLNPFIRLHIRRCISTKCIFAVRLWKVDPQRGGRTSYETPQCAFNSPQDVPLLIDVGHIQVLDPEQAWKEFDQLAAARKQALEQWWNSSSLYPDLDYQLPTLPAACSTKVTSVDIGSSSPLFRVNPLFWDYRWFWWGSAAITLLLGAAALAVRRHRRRLQTHKLRDPERAYLQ